MRQTKNGANAVVYLAGLAGRGPGRDHDGSGFHSSHPVGNGHSASTRFTSSMDRSNLIRGKAERMSREECLS
jgi:hypothetical protein